MSTPASFPHADKPERNQPLPATLPDSGELVNHLGIPPSLGSALRPAELRVWERLMPHCDIEGCSVIYVNYKAGQNRSGVVGYRLTVRLGERTGTQILTARFFPPGDSLSHFREAQRAPLAAPAFGEPLYHLPELEAVVWAFPNDRKVPGVPALLDRKRLATEVAPRLVREAGEVGDVEDVALELIQYNPERSCTVRATARLNEGRSLVFYGKAYHGSKGEEAYRNMRALWLAPQRPARLGMAQPLAYDPEHRTLWQSSLDGPVLATLESTPGSAFLPLLQQAGGAVAALHSIPVPGLRPETLADVCARVQETAGRLSHLKRPLARRVSLLTARLLAEAARLDTRPAVPLHRDLHAKNLILTGSGMAIIDLDQLRAGDPVQDLGSFLANTCARGFKQEVRAADIAEWVRAVLRGYEWNAPWKVPRGALRWYTAAALFKKADRRVKHMKVRSPEAMEQLLDAAEGALSGGGLLEGVL